MHPEMAGGLCDISSIHRGRDSREAGVGGHGSTLRVHRSLMLTQADWGHL